MVKTVIFYIFFTCIGRGEKGSNIVQKGVKKSWFYTGSGEFLCIVQTGGLAEQWSGKIKSGGNMVFFM